MEKPRPRILIVDDTPVNCLICEEILGDDYALQSVGDGESALAAATDFEPDLVLLDVMMPGIDGLEVCRQLRASVRPWVKIIMVSAKAQAEDRIAGYDAGADDYVTKPFDENELLAKVRVHLRLKHVQEIDEVKCRLLDVLSHGNRTPLTHILANADILTVMSESLSANERRERAMAITRGATRLYDWLTTAEQLLELKTGQAAIQAEWEDVSQQITSTTKSVAMEFPSVNVSVDVKAGLFVESDEKLFSQMLERFLRYVVGSARDDGSVVVAASKQATGRVRISITRDGEHIESNRLRGIFEPFARPDEVLHNQGNGLDLAVAKEITLLHGGMVRALNIPTGGVEFQAEFPSGAGKLQTNGLAPDEDAVI